MTDTITYQYRTASSISKSNQFEQLTLANYSLLDSIFNPDYKELLYLNEDSGTPYIREEKKVGRNELCPCGSGKKYKKCCS